MPVSIVVRSRAVFRYCLCLVRFISSLCVVQLFLHCFRPPRVCMCVCVFAGCGANMWPLAAALATDRGLECVQTISDWMYFILHTIFSWFFVNEFSIMRPPSPSQKNFSEQRTHTQHPGQMTGWKSKSMLKIWNSWFMIPRTYSVGNYVQDDRANDIRPFVIDRQLCSSVTCFSDT